MAYNNSDVARGCISPIFSNKKDVRVYNASMCLLAVAQWRPDVTSYLPEVSLLPRRKSGLSIDCCVLVVSCVLRRNT